jgi:predicted DNA-binding antitoxin AbrB/MazE fold protein
MVPIIKLGREPKTARGDLKFMAAAAFQSQFHPNYFVCYKRWKAKRLAFGLSIFLGVIGMNKTIHAVLENGVFRPIESVDLPEKSEVEFELRLVAKKDAWPDGYFQQTAGAFANEPYERPSQGTKPRRDDW